MLPTKENKIEIFRYNGCEFKIIQNWFSEKYSVFKQGTIIEDGFASNDWKEIKSDIISREKAISFIKSYYR